MKIKALSATVAVVSLFGSAALAQENIVLGADPLIDTPPRDTALGWSAGIAATARLNTSDDFDHAENELEGFVELTYGGFHGGLTVTTLYQDPDDDIEYEATLGYGSEFGRGMSWDLTYGYIWLDDTEGHAEEITGTLGFPIGRQVEGAFAVILDPDTGRSDQEFGFESPLTDRWSLVGLVGNSDRDENTYAELGAVYAISDNLSFQFLYEDTSDSDGLLGFTFAYAFGS